MSGPKRNPDKLNTIGVVVVGICGAVLVYVTIVALQAFYLNDTSEVYTMADYGGNDATARSIKTSQVGNITEYASNPAAPGKPATYRIAIDEAMKLVVNDAKVDPAFLVPALGRSDVTTVKPIFGRPVPLDQAPPADPGATDPATPPADGTAPAPTDGTAPAPAGGAAPAPAGGAAPPAPAGGAAPAPGGGAAAPAPGGTAPKGNAP